MNIKKQGSSKAILGAIVPGCLGGTQEPKLLLMMLEPPPMLLDLQSPMPPSSATTFTAKWMVFHSYHFPISHKCFHWQTLPRVQLPRESRKVSSSLQFRGEEIRMGIGLTTDNSWHNRRRLVPVMSCLFAFSLSSKLSYPVPCPCLLRTLIFAKYHWMIVGSF